MKFKKNSVILFKTIGLLFLLFILLSCQDNKEPANNSMESQLNFAKTEKKGTKPSDGYLYLVDSDNQTLSAVDLNEDIIWKVNIIDICGEPRVGKPEISSAILRDSVVAIVFGKHNYANVNIDTGEVSCLGAD